MHNSLTSLKLDATMKSERIAYVPKKSRNSSHFDPGLLRLFILRGFGTGLSD